LSNENGFLFKFIMLYDLLYSGVRFVKYCVVGSFYLSSVEGRRSVVIPAIDPFSKIT